MVETIRKGSEFGGIEVEAKRRGGGDVEGKRKDG